jgi:Arc/MetJ-type ribon-helix-helix transcriptional regulator
MSTRSIRRSISITPDMRDLLAQLVAKHGRDVCEADLIRDAIRQYLDGQAAVIGSRRHFQKSLQARIDRLEAALSFHLLVLISLLAAVHGDDADRAIDDAIVMARRDGAALLRRIDAVRDLPEDA